MGFLGDIGSAVTAGAGIAGKVAGPFAKSAANVASMIPAIYRPRPVVITLNYPTTGTKGPNFGLKENVPIQFELSEVTAVRQSTSADVTTFNGVTRSVIQPWYFKPIEMTIEGKSNMGIFDPGVFSVNVGNDADIEKILQLRDAIQEVFMSPETVDKDDFYVTIKYGATDTELKRTALQELRGHISGIDISEEESTPYIKSYTIKFVGEFLTAFNIKAGVNRRKADVVKATDKIAETNVGVTTSTPPAVTAPTTEPQAQSVNADTRTPGVKSPPAGAGDNKPKNANLVNTAAKKRPVTAKQTGEDVNRMVLPVAQAPSTTTFDASVSNAGRPANKPVPRIIIPSISDGPLDGGTKMFGP